MRKFVILAILVVALGTAVFVLRQRDDATVREERRAARLLDFDERKVTGFVLTTGGTDWRFVKGDSGWRIVEPIDDIADEVAIDDVMSATETVPVLRTIDEPEALSAYGLDPAVSTVRFDGVDATLHLGDMPPSRDGVFARIEGRPGVLFVALVEEAEPLLKLPDPNRFRHPNFLGIAPPVITTLAVTTSAGEVRAERESDGWWLVSPGRLPASDKDVDQVFRALDGVKIHEYHDGVDPAEPRFGLGPDAVVLSVGSPDATRRFVLGAHTTDGLRYATRDDRGSVMTVATSGVDELSLTSRSLATRRLSRLNRYLVESFSYRRGDESVAIGRENDVWTTEDGQTFPETKVYEFLSVLFETPVTGWRETPAGAEQAVAVLQYRLQGGQEGSIEFLPGEEGRVSEASGIVYGLAGAAPGVPRR